MKNLFRLLGAIALILAITFTLLGAVYIVCGPSPSEIYFDSINAVDTLQYGN